MTEEQRRARAARFAAPLKPGSGLRSKGSAVLSLAEQRELFARVPKMPRSQQGYALRQLREATTAGGPSTLGRDVFVFAVQHALETGTGGGNDSQLHSILRHLLEVEDPANPLDASIAKQFRTIYVLVLAAKAPHDAYAAALRWDLGVHVWQTLAAVATHDYLRWQAAVGAEPDVYIQHAMRLAKPRLHAAFQAAASKFRPAQEAGAFGLAELDLPKPKDSTAAASTES